MVTVRYPSGLVITYNAAHYVVRSQQGWVLYDGPKKERVIACIQLEAGVVVEFLRPCAIRTEGKSPADALRALLNDGLQEIPGYLLADLKQRLQGFDARKRSWK